jgi:hypothetical protein
MSTENQNPRRPGGHAPGPGASTVIPEPAADDPKARAAARAAQLRDHIGGMDEAIDEFAIDPRIIPDGWCYEWKALEVLGKQDHSYQVSLAHRGWEAVPRSRHPELMPDTYTGETITRKGQILMERPQEITDEVRARDKRRAREQVSAKETQLGAAPAGQFERDNKGNPLVSVKKSMESIPIPEK